jgi:hypothetical protein
LDAHALHAAIRSDPDHELDGAVFTPDPSDNDSPHGSSALLYAVDVQRVVIAGRRMPQAAR